jgi:hypothetical protein
MKNVVFWDVTPCDSCRKRRFRGSIASNIRVERLSELGTMLAASSNRIMLRRNNIHPDDGGDNFLRNVGSYKVHKT